jgi:hypothetical protein
MVLIKLKTLSFLRCELCILLALAFRKFNDESPLVQTRGTTFTHIVFSKFRFLYKTNL